VLLEGIANCSIINSVEAASDATAHHSREGRTKSSETVRITDPPEGGTSIPYVEATWGNGDMKISEAEVLKNPR